MARDYVGYQTADYVRGTLTDAIFEAHGRRQSIGGGSTATPAVYCHQCGETQKLVIDGCHTYCRICKSVSEGCGD